MGLAAWVWLRVSQGLGGSFRRKATCNGLSFDYLRLITEKKKKTWTCHMVRVCCEELEEKQHVNALISLSEACNGKRGGAVRLAACVVLRGVSQGFH